MTRLALLAQALLALSLLTVGCDGETPADDDSGTPPSDAGVTPEDSGPPLPATLGPEDRPADYQLPGAYDGETPLPAVIVLHGYGANGAAQSMYLGLPRLARTEGFYLVTPDGTTDSGGRRFWNATDACCDFAGTGVDDVAYILGLIDELEALVPVSDVYLVGHSNGGFMSYRMACEHPDRITAIASLAGSDYLGDEDCVPDGTVAVLQIHGDMDPTIEYDGATLGAAGYPSAPAVVERWAGRNGCDTSMTSASQNLDLDTSVDGAETTVLRYEAGCSANAALWTIEGGGHIPPLSSDFAPAVYAWLSAQSR